MKYLGLMIILMTLYSCYETFPVPSDKNGEPWGFNSAEVIQSIEFEDSIFTIDLEYKARVTSNRHGVRLLFPKISREVETFDIAKDIRKQFDSLEFKIIDEGNKVISEFDLNFEKKNSNQLSYLGKDSLVACIIIDDFKLIRDNKYKIYLKIPKKKDVDVRVQTAIMALGTKGYSHF